MTTDTIAHEAPATAAKTGLGFELLRNIDVQVSVELGSASLPLREIMALDEDAIVPLNRQTDELLDLFVNGKLIARGEVVAQEGKFALRIVEMCGGDGSPKASDT